VMRKTIDENIIGALKNKKGISDIAIEALR
jgi:hypothetical protein